MRKQLAILGTSVLLLTISCSGCDQLINKPNRITVNIMAAVYVNAVDAAYRNVSVSVDGITVTIFMTRNGGNRLAFDRIVQNGLCQATGVQVFSEGETIEVTAIVQGNYSGYHPVAPGTARLEWETASASVNIGGMYDWYPHIFIKMQKESL
jgi:hypothetical protein